MKKIIGVFLAIILIILLRIYIIYMFSNLAAKILFEFPAGKELEVTFVENELNEDENKEIFSILNLNNNLDVKIEKILYVEPYRHESEFSIIYSAPSDIEIDNYNIIEKKDNRTFYKYYKGVSNTDADKDFLTIKRIFKKYYSKK